MTPTSGATTKERGLVGAISTREPSAFLVETQENV